MSVKLDWEILDQDDKWPTLPAPPPPQRQWRKPVIALAIVVITILGAAGGYLAWLYRTRLKQVSEPVRAVALLEARAVASNDRELFLALQDPDNPDWRRAQEERFGQLEQVGIPEFGWQVAGEPHWSDVALEPGGAQIEATYRFTVENPLPQGPTLVVLRVPQFYRQVGRDWVRALPNLVDYWGRWQVEQREHVTVGYYRRDADIIEPLIPLLDSVVERLCYQVSCPAQVVVTFQVSADSLVPSRLHFNFSSNHLTLDVASPHLWGVPADAASRNEFYRAIQTHLARGLLEYGLGRQQRAHPFYRTVEQWQLADLGLQGPLITPAMTRTLAAQLQAGVWVPLDAISLLFPLSAADSLSEIIAPLSVVFVQQYLGDKAVFDLLSIRLMLGEALARMSDRPIDQLNVAWWKYLRAQAGLPVADIAPPKGQVTLRCQSDVYGTAIWDIHTDGTGRQRIASDVSDFAWSPDGKYLAFISADNFVVTVVDENGRDVSAPSLQGSRLGWLPDNRLWVGGTEGVGSASSLLSNGAVVADLDSGEMTSLAGVDHLWSPDGQRVAYLSWPNLALWAADSNGHNARQMMRGWRLLLSFSPTGRATARVATGYLLAWSPDSRYLALAGQAAADAGLLVKQTLQIADVVNNSTRTLISADDLLARLFERPGMTGEIDNLAWSPVGDEIAIATHWKDTSKVALLDAKNGVIRAQAQMAWRGSPPQMEWSPTGSYLVIQDAASIIVWNRQSGIYQAVPGKAWGWSPDGKWLAVLQDSGVLLVTPDLAAMHWLESPNCSRVIWRPCGTTASSCPTP